MRLREVAAARVEATSLRQVAREVKLTPRGLWYFLEGGEPRSATRRKLETWYVRFAADQEGEVDTETVSAALEVLSRSLPQNRRAQAVSRAVHLYEELHQEAGTPLPEWIRRLREPQNITGPNSGEEPA